MEFGKDQLSSPWHVCPSTCFSLTNCSLSRYNAQGKLECFNCNTGFFLRLFTPMFTKESNYNPHFWEKSAPHGEYLTIIKKDYIEIKKEKSYQSADCCIDSLKPGLHIVVMVVSTVANIFLTLFRSVLIHVNTLITTSQA